MNELTQEPITGKITANPALVPAGEAAPPVLNWETNAPAAEVYVSEDGEAERLFSTSTVASLAVNWIQPGKSYVFRLYALVPSRLFIEEVTVFREIAGSLSIDFKAESLTGGGKATLRWDVTSGAVGEVWLSEDGAEEKLVSRGGTGSFELTWLRGGVTYVFRLYAATKARQLLDEKQFRRKICGKIGAHPNPVPLEAGSRTTLEWEITPPASGEIFISEDDKKETLVCRGASGSFEVSGLQSGAHYRCRLYSQSADRELLDEVSVSLSPIPWTALFERLRSGRDGPSYSSELIEFIAAAITGCLHREEFASWFRLWEERGFHVTPVHFYEPIPDLRTLPNALFEGPQELAGIDMNGEGQRRLLCEVFPALKEEYQQIPLDSSPERSHFYLRNGRFEGLDPLLAYCMVRHFKPARIIEVGSGYSTLLLAQAARANRATELHSIEPYPEGFLKEGVPGLTSLLAKKVEEVDLSYFSSLDTGDFLFIDTSHVVRTGGDVNFLFLEVLPRLKPGVMVHVHDIFFPFEYPRDWVVERRRFWTEQYLLRAFLAFNFEFEVLVSSGYLKHYFPEELKAIFPKADPWQGGSFWMRRRNSVMRRRNR